MASRRDYYFRQKVTEAELDAGFEGLEQADFNLAIDHDLTGIVTGLGVGEAAAPDLTVDVVLGTAYSKQGERIRVGSTQNVDCSQDDGGTPTTVTTPGNTKVVSVFIEFDRALSDPRIDGNSLTVYFVRAESFAFSVVQGSEAVIGSESPPPLDSGKLLLADIRLENGTTQILNAHTVGAYDQIDTTRREDAFKFTGGTVEIIEGSAYDALDSLLTALNNHIDGAANVHPASEVSYNDTPTWLNGATLDGATAVDDVQEAIAAIMSDLALELTGNSGAHRVGKYQTGAWHDGTVIGSSSISFQIDAIISNLAATSGKGGLDKIGAAAQSSGAESVSVGSIYDQITELLAAIALKAPLAGTNVFSGTSNSFTNTLNADGDLTVDGDLTLDNTLTFTEVDNLTEILRSMMSVTPPNYLVTNWGRCLIFAFDANYASNQMEFRLYGSSGSITTGQEAFEIAINCWWNGGTAGTWQQTDTAFPSILIRLAHTGITYQHKDNGAGAGWADAAWDETLFELDRSSYSGAEKATLSLEDGSLRFRNTTAAASAVVSNPTQATTPNPNTLYSKNICKAWGYFDINTSGVFTTVEGFNLQTPSDPGASSDFDFDFRTALDDSHYAVVCCDMTGRNDNYVCVNEATGGFSVRLYDADAGTATNHDAVGLTHQVGVIVFGTDTSA